jgi:voltage-gated potassium channel
MNYQTEDDLEKRVENERYEALNALEEWLEGPIVFLGFVWLIILLIELIWTLNRILETAAIVIWAIFILDFCLRFFLAPKKLKYLKRNWLTAISLVVPALRIFRIFHALRVLRAARAVRGIRLIRVFGSLNRGIKALKASLGRRGFIYVVILTLIITFVGAAGMYTFESSARGGNGFITYGESLWWTAMIMTTLGSAEWPITFEGRVLGFFLSLYAFTIFGYVTATLATFFIDRDAQNEEGEIAGEISIRELKEEIKLLRESINRSSQT